MRKLISRLLRVRGDARMRRARRLIRKGRVAEQEGRLRDAIESYRAATTEAPLHSAAYLNLAIALEASGNTHDAMDSYRQALALDPKDAYANYNVGKLFYELGDTVQAEAHLQRALASRIDFPEALVMRSSLREAASDLAGAASDLEAALAHRPGYTGALRNYASVLQKLGREGEAEAALRRASATDAQDANLIQELADLIARQGRFDEAAECYEKAIHLRPDFASWRMKLGNVLANRGQLDDAVRHYRDALALEPGLADAELNLCKVLYLQGRASEAKESLRELLSRVPGFIAGYLDLAHILGAEQKYEEAEAALKRALDLDPANAGIHVRLGHLHKARDDIEIALRCYERALSLDPQSVDARWGVAMTQLRAIYETDEALLQSRRTFSEQLVQLDDWTKQVPLSETVEVVGSPSPFYIAYQEYDNRELLQRHGDLCARIMGGWLSLQPPRPAQNRGSRERIRIAVISAYFNNHSVWNALVKGWLKRFDRNRFAIDAYHLGGISDQETRLARSLASHFDERPGNLSAWVERIAARPPDVLVYPEVGMDQMTLKLASMRLAPVQMATWGHPETTGLPTIDVFLSAQDLEPPRAERSYRERLIRLPNLGCSFPASATEPVVPDLHRMGIDPSVPILVCPGTPFKYAPRHDAVLPRIAKGLGACQFVFFSYRVPQLSDKLRARLRHAFELEGLDPDRFLRFVPWLPPAQFAGLMTQAHIFLDTIGFSGFNTAMQAVECSLPIVTREGDFLRGRLASGILKRLNLEEFVTVTDEGYADLAIRICRDAALRASVRERMTANRSLLFDDPAPVEALEDLLVCLAEKTRNV